MSELMKKLADYEFADEGPYNYAIDPDDCCYDGPDDLLQTGFLDFCGCGDPEANLEYVRAGLRLIGAISDAEFGEPTDRLKGELVAHCGNEASVAFFRYWADSKGFTEHGASIGYGWLTAEGRQLLALLDEFAAMSPDDQEG